MPTAQSFTALLGLLTAIAALSIATVAAADDVRPRAAAAEPEKSRLGGLRLRALERKERGQVLESVTG